MDFYYTSIARLRAEGMDETRYPDESLLRRRILMLSKMINRITNQYFQPVYDAEQRMSGRDSALLYLSKKVPILQIDEINFHPEGSTADVIDSDYYVIHLERFFARQAGYYLRGDASLSTGTWEEGFENYTFKGWSGWLEDRRELTISIDTDLVQDDEEVSVPDATGFVEGDFIVVIDSVNSNRFGTLINAVDYGTNKIAIDKAQTRGITYPSATSNVLTFGRVPDSIVWACTRMVVNEAALLVPENGDPVDPDFESRLKSEKTDNYSYTMFSPKDMNVDSGQLPLGTFTGDPKVDMVLATYVAPVVALSV